MSGEQVPGGRGLAGGQESGRLESRRQAGGSRAGGNQADGSQAGGILTDRCWVIWWDKN